MSRFTCCCVFANHPLSSPISPIIRLPVRFAIKTQLCPKESEYHNVLREVRFLRTCRHPCVIDVHDAFLITNPRYSTYYIYYTRTVVCMILCFVRCTRTVFCTMLCALYSYVLSVRKACAVLYV